MDRKLLVKIASVALAVFLSVTLIGLVFGGVFIAPTINPQAEIYAKVEKLSEAYKQNLLILVEHQPVVIQAQSDNTQISTDIKKLMDFQLPTTK